MKKKIFTVTAAMIIICIVTVFAVCQMTGAGRQFIIKEGQIKAISAETSKIFSANDSKETFEYKLNELTDYLINNNLNTVILQVNDDKQAIVSLENFFNIYENVEYFERKDILENIDKHLKKNNIQIILSIDCSQLNETEIDAVIEQINNEYLPAGVLLYDYSAGELLLQNIKNKVNDKFENYYLGIKCEYDKAESIAKQNSANLFIIDEDVADYSGKYGLWKNGEFWDSKILISYESTSFLNDLFILSNFNKPDGYILGKYTSPETDLSLYHNVLNTETKLEKFSMSVDSKFDVTSPKKDMSTYAQGIFVMGSADSGQPLYVNGAEVKTEQNGTFGVYLQLEEGDNEITVTQGDNAITRIVTKKTYQYVPQPINFDNTQKAENGQVVQTTGQLTSVLSTPDDDSRIIDGLQQGVQMVVEESVKTIRNGKYTWAYKLSNGGYVLAKNVEWVDETNYQQAIVENVISEINSSEYSTIRFEVKGKPAIVSSFDDEKVKLTFLNTNLSDAFDGKAVEDDEKIIIQGNNQKIKFSAYQEEKNLVIEIPNITEEGYWGYNVKYEHQEDYQKSSQNSFIELYLKNPPHKTKGAKPLTGITVMLDAGHGDDDNGALGLGGVAGPNEKDLNLAVTIATKQCLEKLGATVYLTREDDTFLTLDERRNLVNEIKPDIFISQHHNSLEYTVDGTKAAGFESYFFTPQSKAVSEIMASRISDATGRNNRGFGYGYYYVLRNDIAPCVLNEYGFVINPKEYSELYQDENIYKAAFATAEAVVDVIPE